MGQATTFEVAQVVPGFQLWNLPFLFESDEHVDQYLASEHSKKCLNALREVGLVAFGQTYSGGLLSIYGDRMTSFQEVRGKKFAPEAASTSWGRQLEKKFGAKLSLLDHDEYVKDPRGKNYNEIIEATADQIFLAGSKATVFVNRTHHRVISRVLFISKKFYDSLPGELQKIVMEEGARAAEYERSLSIGDVQRKFREIGAAGLLVNPWSVEQRRAERQRFRSLYSAFEKIDRKAVGLVDALVRSKSSEVVSNRSQ